MPDEEDREDADERKALNPSGKGTGVIICGRDIGWLDPRGFMRELTTEFGTDFAVMLFSCYFGVKGTLYTMLSKGQLPYYMDYIKTSGADYQKYGTIAMTPWPLKAAMGALSDTVPIMGYHKSPYIVIATVLGLAGYVLLAVLPLGDDDSEGGKAPDDQGNTTMVAPVLFFVISLQIAAVDLLCQGRYAKMMVEKPKTGSTLVSWVWACYFLGALTFGYGLIGPISDNYSPRLLFGLGVPFAFQILIPTLLGYMKEERLPSSAIQTDKIRSHPRLYVLAILMAIGALSTNILTLFYGDLPILILSWTWSIILVALSYWAMSRTLAHANTYMFFCNAFYVLIPGSMDPWYTGDPQCVPDGPHFSNTYYLTYSGIVGSIAALVGVCVFQIVFKNSTFRKAFWTTTVMKIVASGFDIIIVKRWHRPAIPDKVMYMFGDAIIAEVAAQLDFMPSVVLVSKVCPPGYESMVYAMLGGFQNFGMQVARYTGGALATAMGVEISENGGVCSYDNLPLLIFICHMLMPLLTIPLVFVLIPDARLTDDVLTSTMPQGYNLEMYSIASDETPPPHPRDSFDNEINEALYD
eukprot:TRINITY_DN4644_c0_g1_i5.p1 TRINITY_DN4644_c0_g1~~TRINITY_DN4644_c0_g1_i5.p1  ORF type:complete len:612 (+),score=117.24 TRINITY_DN4644_c0_g1_i5:97-1836(+)